MIHDKFSKIYLNIINESKEKSIKIKFTPFIFKSSNNKIFEVIESNLNNDVNHVSNRLNDRKIYNMNDIVLIIKYMLEQFITNPKYEKYTKNKNVNQGFTLYYKTKYPSIKIAANIYLNPNKVALMIDNPNKQYPDYICKIKTILYGHYKSYSSDYVLKESVEIVFSNNKLNSDGYFKNTIPIIG